MLSLWEALSKDWKDLHGQSQVARHWRKEPFSQAQLPQLSSLFLILEIARVF